MEINHPERLEAAILLGIVNEKLRLKCPDRQALYYEMDMPVDQLDSKLDALGYHYDAASNQYKPV
ncbi:DUF4250 domain-containing protein [Shewanella submarina]|uniref:DUF4250 domain-containing protein n=1 Tax=Shewanella submarina TaxID=2016376 RepID=A0ABV7GBA9_9GAMM|nr:DUF4250 domain-containing protein [Shewanella submarina]MCL1036662.1 DUF4250 domain-containing protein [Shewanella submarina]